MEETKTVNKKETVELKIEKPVQIVWINVVTTIICGMFHHDFFKKRLWRKIKSYKHTDESEVLALFISFFLSRRFGIYSMPIGQSWSSEVTKEQCECYYDQNKEIISAWKHFYYEGMFPRHRRQIGKKGLRRQRKERQRIRKSC